MTWALITVPAAMVLFFHCVCALNHMSIRTRNRVRFAYIGLLLTSAAAALAPAYGVDPSAAEAAWVSFIAVFVLANQRRRYMEVK